LQPLLTLKGSNEEKVAALSQLLAKSEIGMKGIDEIKFVLNHLTSLGLTAVVDLDVSLARGLNYYTGTILEVKANDVEMGSITGGGRYDNLTGVFGMPGLSGVGISFGADRIFDVLNTLNLYPADTVASTKVIFLNLGEDEASVSLKYIKLLRSAGVPSELYPDASKMKKQMSYANDKHIPFVAIVGDDEIANNTVALKNMATGEQESLKINDIISKLSK
jgi:histidyl-tRNA synthetase